MIIVEIQWYKVQNCSETSSWLFSPQRRHESYGNGQRCWLMLQWQSHCNKCISRSSLVAQWVKDPDLRLLALFWSLARELSQVAGVIKRKEKKRKEKKRKEKGKKKKKKKKEKEKENCPETQPNTLCHLNSPTVICQAHLNNNKKDNWKFSSPLYSIFILGWGSPLTI